jgi:cobalt-zinc-cadmium efflux system membrane fusion protein
MRALAGIRAVSFSLFALAAMGISGCSSEAAKKPGAAKQAAPAVESSAVAADWCVEHGVPESQCGRCNAKVAADLKKKGDWCKEHDRPESQCFLCNPKLEAKFAAEYEARYGKSAPKPEAK